MIAVVRITGVAVNIIRNVAAEIHCWIDIYFLLIVSTPNATGKRKQRKSTSLKNFAFHFELFVTLTERVGKAVFEPNEHQSNIYIAVPKYVVVFPPLPPREQNNQKQ